MIGVFTMNNSFGKNKNCWLKTENLVSKNNSSVYVSVFFIFSIFNPIQASGDIICFINELSNLFYLEA